MRAKLGVLELSNIGGALPRLTMLALPRFDFMSDLFHKIFNLDAGNTNNTISSHSSNLYSIDNKDYYIRPTNLNTLPQNKQVHIRITHHVMGVIFNLSHCLKKFITSYFINS